MKITIRVKFNIRR